MTFFKGYIETKNKKAKEKFKNRDDLKSYRQVKNLDEYAGVLSDDTILIDIDDFEQSEILFDIVKDKKLKCRVYATSRGKHFLFKNKSVEGCKTHTKLAVGVTADIKVGTKNSYEVLKYNNIERKILYDCEEYELIPKFLFPIKSKIDFTNLGEGDGRNQALFNYILTLQSNDFGVEESRETIKLINEYVLESKLDEREIETILRDDAFEAPIFFEKGKFLFDVFARFLKNTHHIIKINNNLHFYKNGIYECGEQKIEGLMIDYISNLNRSKRKEVIDYLDIMIKEDTEVNGAEYIAFKNGVYNIDTNEFLQFTPNIILTNKINHNYNESAESDVVDNVLNKLACNNNEVRELLEEVVGYCFYRRNELRKAFILTGDKSNGKSTYIDMIKTLLGEENTTALDLKELGDRFKTAELFGKLANLGDDIGDEFVSNTSIFKKVVSGDRINAERKGQNPFDFNNYSKFIFSANNIPRMGRGKDSKAIIDRLIIVPFENTFSVKDSDYDPYIKYKLREESAIEYLIQLGIDGLIRVLENQKFTTTEKMKKELEEYEINNNPVLAFFKEIEESTLINNPTSEIYRQYVEFCLTNNFNPISNIEFSRQTKKEFKLEIKTKRVNGKIMKIFIKSY